MLEVEAKYRASHAPVRERLGLLGFSPAGLAEEEDVYFQHPCRDFAATDEALRLRISGGRAELTYKGPRAGAGAKTRLEVSVAVSGDAALLLRSLGFAEVARVRKRREIYRRGSVTVYLDLVEGLGEFVEVETLAGSGSDAARAAGELRRLAGELGLREEVRETYLELLLRDAPAGKRL
jgi:adenylate cyclase class 2